MLEDARCTMQSACSWSCDLQKHISNKKHEVDAQVTNEKEDHLLVTTYFSTKKSLFLNDWQQWYKAHDNVKNLFKEFVSTENKKVRIRNGGYIPTNGKGVLAIKARSGTKTTSNVLCLILIKICWVLVS